MSARTDWTGWEEKMLQAGRDGLSVAMMCRDVLKVSRRTYENIRRYDEKFEEVHQEYNDLCLAYWENMGKTALEDGGKFNTPLYKLFMANKFGWSDKQEVKQEVDQKTDVQIVIGGGARSDQNEIGNGSAGAIEP